MLGFFRTANFCLMNQIHKAYIRVHILYYVWNVSYVNERISLSYHSMAFHSSTN